MSEPLKLYHLEPDQQVSPITKQDVYDTVATSLNLGNNRISPSGIVSRNVVLGGKTFFLAPGEEGSIQRAINILEQKGGGTLNLTAGTYKVTTTITVPSSVRLIGDGAGLTIIDFLNSSAGISVVGSNAYSTGTISVTNDGTTVTGSGTTFTSAMVGRFILLSEQWYEITVFGSTTSLTIGTGFSGTTLSGATFVIASIIQGFTIQDITLQNSTGTLLRTRYCNYHVISGITFDSGAVGLDDDDSSTLQMLDGYFSSCTNGATLDNSQFITWLNTSIDSSSGTGLAINNTKNSAIEIVSFQNCGAGMTIQNSSNLGFENFAINQSTNIGLEFVSGNSSITVQDGEIKNSGSDGLKLTASTDECQFVAVGFENNTGYGMNIAAASCDDNVIGLNNFKTNTAGNLQDLGTGSVIGLNAGV